jgi:hypothetical protein
MKTILLNHFTQKPNGYEIFLGNGLRRVFVSKKDAARFLAETNRFLLQRVVELNEIYIRAYSEYRRAWFVIQHFKEPGRKHYIVVQEKIKWNLEAAADQFDRVFSHRSDNAFSFISALKICMFIKEASDQIAGINKARNITYNTHVCERLALDVVRVSEEIRMHGQEDADNRVSDKQV